MSEKELNRIEEILEAEWEAYVREHSVEDTVDLEAWSNW